MKRQTSFRKADRGGAAISACPSYPQPRHRDSATALAAFALDTAPAAAHIAHIAQSDMIAPPVPFPAAIQRHPIAVDIPAHTAGKAVDRVDRAGTAGKAVDSTVAAARVAGNSLP